MTNKTIEQRIDNLAQMTQHGFLETKTEIGQIRREMVTGFQEVRREMATKVELRETEERLLDAVRGVEVKKRDFDTLADDVEDLDHRVGVLEKKRL